MQITIYKEDIETGTTTQGDAHLEGAEYTLYRDEACTETMMKYEGYLEITSDITVYAKWE